MSFVLRLLLLFIPGGFLGRQPCDANIRFSRIGHRKVPVIYRATAGYFACVLVSVEAWLRR